MIFEVFINENAKLEKYFNILFFFVPISKKFRIFAV